MKRQHKFKLALLVFAAALGVQAAGAGAVFAQQADLSALQVDGYNINLPPTATSTQASDVQHGYRNWMSIFNNNSQAQVTNTAITAMSGYDPALFDMPGSFPVTIASQSLLPGGSQLVGKMMPGSGGYSIPVDYTLGYDSTKSVNPSAIPAGGGQQTVTVTVTPRDSRYVGSDVTNISFHIFVYANIPDVTLLSATGPSNLDQGEDVQETNSEDVAHWQLGSPQLNKTYTFTAVLNVPNSTGAPYDFQPVVQIDGQPHTITCEECTGSSVTVADPTLDGDTPGSGAVTFSVAEADRTWQSTHGDLYGVVYQGTEPQQPQEPTQVSILIRPGSKQPAHINPRSHGVLPVAVLSSKTFDATTIDRSTVAFGPMGPTQATPILALPFDVNHDGKRDMLFVFLTQQTGVGCEAPNMSLSGQTTDGQPIVGTAPIKVVGCKN